jgi:protein-tyrosine phosphatase
MELFQVDDGGLLFISPAINDWNVLTRHNVDTIIDLDGDIDEGVPTCPNKCLYIYFPILDEELPDLDKLHAIGDLGARIVIAGHRVLSHCGMGFNRSALVAGVILHKLGMPGPNVVQRLRERRPGALFNDCFAAYLQSLGKEAMGSDVY